MNRSTRPSLRSSLLSILKKDGPRQTRSGDVAAPRTLDDLWAGAAERHAERLYLEAADGSWRLTYAESDRTIRSLEAGLVRQGVSPGDRLIVDATPSGVTALLFWAAVRRGAIVVPLDAGSAPDAVAAIASRCTPVLAIAQGDLAVSLGAAGVATMTADEIGGAERGAGGGTGPRPEDTAVILFTSGTTGTPKGVALSHAALTRSGRLVCEAWGIGAADRLLSIGPYHTMSALRNPLIATAYAGAAGVVPEAAEERSAIGVVETCRARSVTVLSTVPALIKVIGRMDADMARPALAGLRLVLCTAAALTSETRAAFALRCTAPVLDYYGLTETCGACIFQDSVDPPVGSIGRPRGVAIRIERPDGTLAATGDPGELLVSGDTLMQGYWGQPDETAKVLRDGWLRTGDIVCRDESGVIHLVGRSRDIVKRPDGELVDLGALQRVAEGTGRVADAAACACTDEHGDEAVILFVVPLDPSPDADALRNHLRSVLGRTVRDIVVRDGFPRGANGKILKHALLQAYLAEQPGRSAA